MVAKCWRASSSVGAIIAAWAPASTQISMASSATRVLPLPTSPCSSRTMRSSLPRSSAISAMAWVWLAVSSNPSEARAASRSRPSPSSRDRPGCGCDGAPARWRAGLPAIRRRPGAYGQGARREITRFLGGVDAGDGALPVAPALFPVKGGVLPFGKSRRAFDGRRDGLLHRPLGEPSGQAIEGLDPQDPLALRQWHDMVGVRHLHLALVEFDLAAHHAGLARRQQLLEIVLATVEVGQAEPAALVAAPDLVGLPRAVRDDVLVDVDSQRRDLAAARLGDIGRVPRVDHAGGQMPQKVDDQRAGQLLHKRAQPRTDSGQRRDVGKEGREGLRAHGWLDQGLRDFAIAAAYMLRPFWVRDWGKHDWRHGSGDAAQASALPQHLSWQQGERHPPWAVRARASRGIRRGRARPV